MYGTVSDVRVIIYVSKLLFPKYPPYQFITYMILAYSKILLKQKRFRIVTRPDAYLTQLLKDLAVKFAVDISNCVFIKGDRFQRSFAKVHVLKCRETKPRFVQIFILNNTHIKNDEVLLSSTLEFNIRSVNGIRDSLNIKFTKPSEAVLASEVEVSQVNIFCDIPSDIVDTTLKQYFAIPRILYKKDVIPIHIKEYASQHYYTNKQANEIRTVYFKCNKAVNNEKPDWHGCFICVGDQSCLKLAANVQSFIPRTTEIISENYPETDQKCVLDICPDGLTNHFAELKASVKPFLSKNDLNLDPLFLIHGTKGCGKDVVVKATAAALGLHMYKVSSVDIAATSYSQVESKLRGLLFKIKLVSPCIFAIDNFENFGKNHEGLYDQRIIYNFQSELQTLFKSNTFPVIVICLSNKKQIHSDLKRLFLKIFEMEAPAADAREQMLTWLLQRGGLRVSGDLNAIAGKCHGFYFEDLEALVFHALRMNYGEGSGGFINEKHFFKALDLMQANYSKSMGAPKVPKVEWSDIGGLEDIKREIVKTVQLPLKHPEYFSVTGLKRSGILLYGPPGTGKTLIAKAVATECNLCFLSVKGPELLNMYVGQSEENIRNVFERAREAAPCIIFFDELDSLAPNRGATGDSGGVMDRVVSQLLAEMDGLNKSATVVIIGATNRPDLLDPALLRPGRFDKLLYVGPCSTKEAKVSVLRALTKKFKLSSDVNLGKIVDLCPANITGADYYGLCSDAWMSAARKLIRSRESHTAELDAEDVVVSVDDFSDSMRNLKPSIKAEDLRYFEKLQSQFS